MHLSPDEPHLPRAQLPPVASALALGEHSRKDRQLHTQNGLFSQVSYLACLPSGSSPWLTGEMHTPLPEASTFQTHHAHPPGGPFAHTSPTAFPVFKGYLSSPLFQKCLLCPPPSSEFPENALSVPLLWHLAGATLGSFFTLTTPSWQSFVPYCFWIPTHLSGSWRSVESC